MKELNTNHHGGWQPWEVIFRYWCGDLKMAGQKINLGPGAVHTNITEGGL